MSDKVFISSDLQDKDGNRKRERKKTIKEIEAKHGSDFVLERIVGRKFSIRSERERENYFDGSIARSPQNSHF